MEKVKVSTDGTIDFKTDESIPSTAKRFKQSPEIEAFYRFVAENDLREEALAILNVLQEEREAIKIIEKEERKRERQLARQKAKEEKAQAKSAAKGKAKTTKTGKKKAKSKSAK